MSGPYVKIFGSILNSSVWCETANTRLVWLTLLLLADGDGCVWGAVPGIARQAGVPIDATRAALEKLGSPDPESRSQDEEGRRILTIDGGWMIVNHRKYREMQTDGQRKASRRARRYRERKRHVTSRDDHGASRATRTEEEEESESEEESEGKAKKTTEGAPPPVSKSAAGKLLLTFLDAFNLSHGRRVSAVAGLERKIADRLKEGFHPWQVVATPILGCAYRLSKGWKLSDIEPEVYLRDGTHPRTQNGQTSGAKHWMRDLYQAADHTVLSIELAGIAGDFGVLDALRKIGVRVRIEQQQDENQDMAQRVDRRRRVTERCPRLPGETMGQWRARIDQELKGEGDRG